VSVQGTDDVGQTDPRKPLRRRLIRLLLILGLLGVLLLTTSFGYGAYRFQAVGPAQEDTTVMLSRGMSLSTIARTLNEVGSLSDPLIFTIAVRLKQLENRLKAGEYIIPARASMADILDLLDEGKSILYPLTVPEGLTSQEVMALVAEHPKLNGDMPETPEEGSLLPETYLFERGTTRAGLVRQMQIAKSDLIDELWPERAGDLPFETAYQAEILASIVEKETAVPEERPRVAAVFVNRLRRPMRLQSDPTIIYGLTQGNGPLGRPIRQSELRKKTPYNTYLIDGLPPTPIANAGRAALEAVLNPPNTKELYFVADGTGGHAFAETHAEHLKNVKKWRHIERESRR